jgi:hypothetical protein
MWGVRLAGSDATDEGCSVRSTVRTTQNSQIAKI